LCLDAFHVVAWATDALDQVRRDMVNRLRAGGHHDEATALTLSIHGDLAGRVSERRKAPLTWENEGVEANILP
jgi:transposase